jgi:phosphate transport system protein
VTVHLEREIANLKKQLLSLGAMVEDSLRQAVKAVSEGNSGIANKVIEGDVEIDHMEVEVEEECLKVLALYQPVATDLRFIVAVLKINNDLERIGDLAVNIAERAVTLAGKRQIEHGLWDFFNDMQAKSRSMVKDSLDSLVNLDVKLAQKVRDDDDEVDSINRIAYDQTKVLLATKPEWIETLVPMVNVFRHLERVADQATNIAEDVIYMCQGQIVRHRPDLNGTNQ